MIYKNPISQHEFDYLYIKDGFVHVAGWLKLEFGLKCEVLLSTGFDIVKCSQNLRADVQPSYPNHNIIGFNFTGRVDNHSNKIKIFVELADGQPIQLTPSVTKRGNKKRKQVTFRNIVPRALIITHRFGGGSQFFEGRILSKLSRGGYEPWTLYFDLNIGKYVLEKFNSHTGDEKYIFSNIFEMWRSNTLSYFRKVIVNHLISFPRPFMLMKIFELRMLKEKLFFKESDLQIEYYIHDFFLGCPSVHLLSKQRIFCNIPSSMEECNDCLNYQKLSISSKFSNIKRKKWIKNTKKLLSNSEMVYFFSDTSFNIMQKLIGKNVLLKSVIKRHDISHLPKSAKFSKPRNEKRIAIVGNLNEAKGENIFLSLLNILRDTNSDYEFFLYGNMSNANSLELFQNIKKSQQFRDAEELYEKVDTDGISKFIFPSVCPETFSFTIHELMVTGLPILGFDIGEQGSLIKNYKFGAVTSDISAYGLSKLLEKK